MLVTMLWLMNNKIDGITLAICCCSQASCVQCVYLSCSALLRAFMLSALPFADCMQPALDKFGRPAEMHRAESFLSCKCSCHSVFICVFRDMTAYEGMHLCQLVTVRLTQRFFPSHAELMKCGMLCDTQGLLHIYVT